MEQMSWLDNVVAWISPEAGAKRAAWRATYNELRNYDAGNNSRTQAWIFVAAISTNSKMIYKI